MNFINISGRVTYEWKTQLLQKNMTSELAMATIKLSTDASKTLKISERIPALSEI